MRSEVGIFNSRASAEQAVQQLTSNGIPQSSIIFLSGENTDVEQIPTTDTERDGMGKTMGAFLGGAAGAGTGLGIGSAATSLLVPGIGPVIAAGLGAAALLGLGGATAGAALGDSSETALDRGSPNDDVFLYHDLLKNGRTLVIVEADDEEHLTTARRVLDEFGSENIDQARSSLKARHDANVRRAS
jgi:hypothetical protein